MPPGATPTVTGARAYNMLAVAGGLLTVALALLVYCAVSAKFQVPR